MNAPACLGLCAGLLCSTTWAQTLQLRFEHDGQPVADVAVIVTAQQPISVPHQTTAIIDQVQKQFTPYVSVIQTGSKVSFPNKDNIRHHVYSFSPAKPFELKLYSGTPSQPVVFDKAGTVVLGCNIHDWMLAYVLVVDTPFFAVSGKDGVVALNELPAAAYRVQIWHPDQVHATDEWALDLTQQPSAVRVLDLPIKPRAQSGPTNDIYR